VRPMIRRIVRSRMPASHSCFVLRSGVAVGDAHCLPQDRRDGRHRQASPRTGKQVGCSEMTSRFERRLARIEKLQRPEPMAPPDARMFVIATLVGFHCCDRSADEHPLHAYSAPSVWRRLHQKRRPPQANTNPASLSPISALGVCSWLPRDRTATRG